MAVVILLEVIEITKQTNKQTNSFPWLWVIGGLVIGFLLGFLVTGNSGGGSDAPVGEAFNYASTSYTDAQFQVGGIYGPFNQTHVGTNRNNYYVDLNGDNQIDTGDALKVISVKLNRTSFNSAADFNIDGRVNEVDVGFILNAVLYSKW